MAELAYAMPRKEKVPKLEEESSNQPSSPIYYIDQSVGLKNTIKKN